MRERMHASIARSALAFRPPCHDAPIFHGIGPVGTTQPNTIMCLGPSVVGNILWQHRRSSLDVRSSDSHSAGSRRPFECRSPRNFFFHDGRA